MIARKCISVHLNSRSFVANSISSANILAKVTGIDPADHVSITECVSTAAIVGEPFIDLVHPAAEFSNIKLIKVVDALNIGAVVIGDARGPYRKAACAC